MKPQEPENDTQCFQNETAQCFQNETISIVTSIQSKEEEKKEKDILHISKKKEPESEEISPEPKITYKDVVGFWNAYSGSLPKIKLDTLSDKNKRHISQFLADKFFFDKFKSAVRQVASEPYWIEHRYGLWNLLTSRDNKIDKWASKWDSIHSPQPRYPATPMTPPPKTKFIKEEDA
jgi:hypothetical protein